MDDEQREQEGEIAFDIAVNTLQTADNLRDMGFGEAGDVFERNALLAAQQALESGYTPEPGAPPADPFEVLRHPLPPLPTPIPGEQTSMGPITKDEERRAIEHTKEWEDIKDRLGEGPDVHLDPSEPQVLPGGQRFPPIFKAD